MYDCWLSKCRVAKVSNRCTKNNQTKRLDWLSWFVSVSQINYLSNHRSRSDRSKATLPGKRSIIRGYNCAWVELYFTFRRYYAWADHCLKEAICRPRGVWWAVGHWKGRKVASSDNIVWEILETFKKSKKLTEVSIFPKEDQFLLIERGRSKSHFKHEF